MNHDSEPTPAPPVSQSRNDIETHNDNHNASDSEPQSDDQRSYADTSRSRRRRRRSRRSGSALSKKLEFITHLLTSLDSLFFLEIGTLYYLECSFLRFLLRALSHYAFLTPKPESFPIALPAYPAHVFSILFPNVVCILCHIFMTLPKGTEASRGFLHGGIVIDFIGQTPPRSRLILLAFDAFILAIQSLMLAVHSQREALRGAVKPNRGSIDFLPELRRQLRLQTLDGEERRERRRRRRRRRRERRDSNANNPYQDVEMGAMPDNLEETNHTDEDDETTSLISEPAMSSNSGRQLSEIYASGTAMIGEFHLLQSIRLASTDYSAAAAHSIRTLGYTASLATLLAARERNARTTGR